MNIFQGITLPDAPKFGKVFGGQLVGQVGQLHYLLPFVSLYFVYYYSFHFIAAMLLIKVTNLCFTIRCRLNGFSCTWISLRSYGFECKISILKSDDHNYFLGVIHRVKWHCICFSVDK